MAKRVLGNEVTFTFRYKTSDGRSKRIYRCMETRIIASRIQNTEEKRGGIAMKEEIDWKKKY